MLIGVGGTYGVGAAMKPAFGVGAPTTGTGVAIPLGTKPDWPPQAMSNTVARLMTLST